MYLRRHDNGKELAVFGCKDVDKHWRVVTKPDMFTGAIQSGLTSPRHSMPNTSLILFVRKTEGLSSPKQNDRAVDEYVERVKNKKLNLG